MKKEMIKIEGLSFEEILDLPDDQLDQLVFTGEPIVRRAGTAEVLGVFSCSNKALHIELAQIDGGGEGVLFLLIVLAQKLARRRACKTIEWIVHAANCAEPNLKLRRVLNRRGFKVATHQNTEAYLLTETL